MWEEKLQENLYLRKDCKCFKKKIPAANIEKVCWLATGVSRAWDWKAEIGKVIFKEVHDAEKSNPEPRGGLT